MSGTIKYLQRSTVYLRPLELADADVLYQMTNNDTEMRRLTGTQQAFTSAQIEAYILRQPQDDSRVSFGIARQEDDLFMGEVVINNISRNNRSASFRIAIAVPTQGTGTARRRHG